ncbi:MAG: TPM domain-containing protein [Thermodesulfovibrionales bacterium]
MNRTAATFFTEEEKKRISATTHQVELLTSGEVAVMVVDRSDIYRDAEIIGGIVFGSIAAFALTEIFFSALIWYYIPLSILFFFLFKKLSGLVPELKVPFITAGRKNEAVAQRALRGFYEKGLCKTRDNTGVLFFISLFEHKVWVLADKGIYLKIQQETLNRLALTVTQGIKEGHACDTLCQSITEAGQILAEHFPVRHDDTNELSNEVITG